MPAPIWLAFAVLLGWPLLQLVSVLVARAPRAAMRQTAEELAADDRFGPDDRALVRQALDDSHGSPTFATFPVLLPLALVAMSVGELFGRDRPPTSTERMVQEAHDEYLAIERMLGRPNGAVRRDPRFWRLAQLSSEVSFLRWPVTSLLTILLCLPVMPLLGLAYGLRQIRSILTDAATRLALSLRLASSGMAARH